jgi:hypothetical protein
MTDDFRPTSGQYGNPARSLARDDFAGVVFTLVPVDDSGVVPPVEYVQPEELEGAQRHLRALASAYPDEPIAQLAETVATLLQRAGGSEVAGEHVLCAAALLCQEEAARTNSPNDTAFGSAAWTQLHLRAAVSRDTWDKVQQALTDQP